MLVLGDVKTVVGAGKLVIVFDIDLLDPAEAPELALFGVKVADVRVANRRGKLKRMGRFVGRRKDWKKAYVTLAPGEKSIEFFEGV